MPEEPPNDEREHNLTMQVFSMSGGLVGLCLTAIGLFRLLEGHSRIATIADELLAVNAVLFMLCSCLSFMSVKTAVPARRHKLRRAVDCLFMTASAFTVVIFVLLACAFI